MKTDLELINACLEGNDDAFTELLTRYKNLVYSVILKKVTNPDDANDIAQDVFIKIYKNLATYTAEYKFSTWVMRITGNHLIDQFRRKKLETVSLEDYNENTVVSAEAEYLTREQTMRINKLVANLPDIYKIPVVLYHQEGLSYQEISEKIGEPMSKIKNRIFRGRKLLKSLLQEGGVS